MKKYKLTKIYPGSFALGTEVIKEELPFHEYKTSQGFEINHQEVENFPEFWEEIIEKDYEILSFISKDNQIFEFTWQSSLFHCSFLTYGFYLDEILTGIDNPKRINNQNFKSHGSKVIDKKFKIYSIKRLSDNEIFTINDSINEDDALGPIVISEIKITETEVLLGEETCKVSLKGAKHKKKPLFITEDGVGIFEGNKYYSIGGSKGLWEYENKIFEHTAKIGTGQLHESKCVQNNKIYWLKFSTKQKAEEYILLNKPCLSINDVAKVFVSTNYTTNKGKIYPQGQKLRELVKQKLKINNN